jgi:hypothetical protein
MAIRNRRTARSRADLAVTASDELFPQLCEEALGLGTAAAGRSRWYRGGCYAAAVRGAVPGGGRGLRAPAVTTPPDGLEALRDNEALSRRLHPLAIREPSAEAMATRVMPAVAPFGDPPRRQRPAKR